MCGYCVEYNTFVMIASAQSGQLAYTKPEYIEAIGYLQECPDILSALAATPTDVAIDSLIPIIIACRGLEILLTHGFTAAAYQSLLKTPAYIAAVETLTGGAGKNRPQDPRFDLAAADWVYDRRTYIEAGYLDAQLLQWSFSDAESLLKQYVDFRLMGIGLRRNDLNERFKQTGLLDPIEDICGEDRQVLADHFLAFWCALQWLVRHPEGATTLCQVVTSDPIGVPDFEGLELWLQRRAALLTYDRFGIAPFLRDIALVRADLFQYIGLMRQVSHEDQASLLIALDRLDTPDHQGEHFSLWQWLETGDLQVW